jgi:hypothetical protein
MGCPKHEYGKVIKIIDYDNVLVEMEDGTKRVVKVEETFSVDIYTEEIRKMNKRLDDLENKLGRSSH